MKLIHIGGNKLVFTKNIIGIFSAADGFAALNCACEYISEPPYKSYVVAYDCELGGCKAYFTSLSVRTLLCRLKKHSVEL